MSNSTDKHLVVCVCRYLLSIWFLVNYLFDLIVSEKMLALMGVVVFNKVMNYISSTRWYSRSARFWLYACDQHGRTLLWCQCIQLTLNISFIGETTRWLTFNLIYYYLSRPTKIDYWKSLPKLSLLMNKSRLNMDKDIIANALIIV